ncbi:hypothetical protein BC628DRAFT_1418373 [Trametes gibbosa]|nr:hypothetical protein BC628DRAFT_1418373 [Trametes gibbosa]
MGDNSTDIQDIAQAYLQDYPNVLIENYCIVASSVLLWYDFVLTLPDEYRHMWRRKFTGATAIYLVMRYSAIFDRVFFCLEVLVWNSTDQGCVVYLCLLVSIDPLSSCVDLTHTDDVFTILNYLAIALFTTMRVYGVWGRDWKPLLVALPLSFLQPVSLVPNNIWDDVAPYFGQVFVNIASSRFMLCLRGLYFASGAEDGQTSLRWSDIRFGRGFSSALVGNLGATIDIVSMGAYLSAGDETAPPAPSGCDDEWAEEVPQYFDDPFTMGMKHSDRTDAPVHDAAV